MSEYGSIINNQLIRHRERQTGDKVITYTEQPSQEGYQAVYEWHERESDIVQVWSLIKDDSQWEEYDPTPEEILSILTGEIE